MRSVSPVIAMVTGLLVAACSSGSGPTAENTDLGPGPVAAGTEVPTSGPTLAEAISPQPDAEPAIAEAAEPLDDLPPVQPTEAQIALANASADQCPAGTRFIPGGPPGFDGGFAAGGGTSGQSLFDVAAGGGGEDTESGRIEVPPSTRAGRFIRFGNPNAPQPTRDRPTQRDLRLTSSALAGTWLLTDGSPTCACTITLQGGSGETNPASASACSSGNLAQVSGWRLRREEIVLITEDRSVIGSLFTTDGRVFSGGLTAGGLATLWRE